MASATELMEMDITKMSEIDFKVTIMKAISGLEKNINDNIESLRAEMRANLAEIKKKTVGFRGGGEWDWLVMGSEEGTYCMVHWVLYASNESWDFTSKTNDVLYSD